MMIVIYRIGSLENLLKNLSKSLNAHLPIGRLRILLFSVKCMNYDRAVKNWIPYPIKYVLEIEQFHHIKHNF